MGVLPVYSRPPSQMTGLTTTHDWYGKPWAGALPAPVPASSQYTGPCGEHEVAVYSQRRQLADREPQRYESLLR